jgi:hypothetical protein
MLPVTPPPKAAGPSIASRLASAAVSLGLCLVAIEATARVAAWRRAHAPRTERSFLEYDPDLGWRKAASDEVWLYGEGVPVLFRTDASGLRDPDHLGSKAPGTTRVLLLGDSFVEAGAVAEDASVRAQLERRVDRACRRFEVVNAGTSGYSTDQEYLFFDRAGLEYAPDVVVLFFFSNDLQGNTVTRKKPWFELVDGRLVLRNSPVPAPPEGRRRFSPDPPRPFAPWHGSQFLRWLGDRTERTRPRLHATLADFGLVEPAADHPPTRDWLQAYGPDSELLARRWQVTLALLDALRADVTRHGASFVVFYVPAAFEVDAADWARTRERWRLDGDGWDRERVARTLEQACRARGIPFVDPRPGLDRALAGHRRPYFRDDPHWNEVGHEVAAETLAPILLHDEPCPSETDAHPFVRVMAAAEMGDAQ